MDHFPIKINEIFFTEKLFPSTGIKCWRGCAEKAMLIHCWRESQLIVIVVNEYGGCSKIKSKLPSYLAISFAGIYPKE